MKHVLYHFPFLLFSIKQVFLDRGRMKDEKFILHVQKGAKS